MWGDCKLLIKSQSCANAYRKLAVVQQAVLTTIPKVLKMPCFQAVHVMLIMMLKCKL